MEEGAWHPERARTWKRVLYRVAIFFGCALIYYAVLEFFLDIPLCNTDTQIRPASGLGPVLGLFFGWPGIFGCAAGNLVSDVASEGNPLTLTIYFLIQVVYNAVPYVLWYALNRKHHYPFPRLDSAGKVALYLVIMVFDAVLITLLLMPFEFDTMLALDIHAVRALNNAIFLVYLGIPLLLALERSPLIPLPPPFIHVWYAKRPRANLTQWFVIVLTFAAAALIVLFVGVGYVDYFIEGDADFDELIASIYLMVAVLTVVVFTPMLCMLRYLETHFTRPVELLTNASRSFVAQVEAHEAGAEVPDGAAVDERGITPSLEVRELFDSTNKMRADLLGYVDRLASATAEREHAAAELDIARQIQMGAVPHEFTSFTERYCLGINGLMRPAREVGGDFYDVFDMGERRVAFVIGDVSGKGVPAALFMMRVQSLIREHLLAGVDVGTAFTLVNRRLCERNDALLFVTAFACILDTATGHVVYANAGHNPPSILREGRRGYLSCRAGLVLGAMDTVTYRQGELDLKPGDGLLLYTDGVTEACNEHEEMYGEERLADVLATCDSCGEADVLPRLMAAIDAFAGAAPQFDDVTLLSFSWNLPVERLVLPPEDRCLDDLFAFLKPMCEREGCTPKMLYGLMLVCEEVFVNICHYGFPDEQPRLSVVFEAAVDDKARCLHLTVSDQGVAYNPLSFEPEKVGLGRDHRIGGLGILLVRENVDDIAYERVDGKNILRMTKAFV